MFPRHTIWCVLMFAAVAVTVVVAWSPTFDVCSKSNTSCPDPNSACHLIGGSYICKCKTGYHKWGRELCQDYDDCCFDDNLCLDPRTECINTVGWYTCDCKEGYTMYDNGFCQDIDECSTHREACPDPETDCVNIEGSYICLPTGGYLKLGDTCLERYSSKCALLPKKPPRVVIPLIGGQVLCDTSTDGGGWIVIQRRFNGKLDFYRDWAAYKEGFGDLNTEFWLGNEIIHLMTSKRQHELRVDMIYKGKLYFAQYDTFSIESEEENYTLRVGAFSSKSNTADDLRYVDGQRFSTFDRDNNNFTGNCAARYRSAWWYKNCHGSNLNGNWGNKEYGMGLNWYGLTSHYDSVTYSEMKIRPIV